MNSHKMQMSHKAGKYILSLQLRQLGVKEPSEHTYISNVLIPGIKTGKFVTEHNYLGIARYLFRLYWNKELDEEVLESLRELPLKVKSEQTKFQQAQFCFLPDAYQPQLKIEKVVQGVDYVSEEYVPSGGDILEWNIFFRSLKVKDRVEIEIINSNNDLNTLRKITDAEWVNLSKERAEKKGGFGFGEHNIIRELRIPSFLNIISTNLVYCKLFWENILSNSSLFSELIVEASFRYGVGYGQNTFVHKVENYFPWFIKNKPCIPTTTKEIKKANEVFINSREIKQVAGDYLPVFDYDLPLSSDWAGYLNFIPKLDLDHYLLILEKISEDVDDDGISKRTNLRKIGVIYKRIAEQISDLPESEKRKIEEWGSTHNLLPSTQRFEPARELKWIRIEGFHVDSEKLKIIDFPDKDYINTDGFQDLMSLLGVIAINKFTPKFKDLQLDSSLKKKLEVILPYFILLLERRQFVDGDKEFDRIYELLNMINFHAASEIVLSFEHLGESIEGPGLPVFSTELDFYFKGKWKSPLSLFTLVPELSKLMNVVGVDQELRLLLELDEDEIREWMMSSGLNLSCVKQKKYFTYSTSTSLLPTISDNGSSGEIYITPGADPVAVQEQLMPFVPEASPTAINMEGIYMTKRDYSSHSVVEELPLTKTYSTLSKEEDRLEVGRWSEEFAYTYFSEHPETYTDIIWENKNKESYKPYDFKLNENGKELYIDVKGTPSSEKDIINLSGPEWKFMLAKGDNYAILRIYNAGTKNPRPETTYNPAKLILEGKISPSEIYLQL